MRILVAILLLCFGVQAQVGINTTTPSEATVLEVASTRNNTDYGGFMPPRVSAAQRDAIPVTTADDGLLIFLQEGSERCVQIYDGVVGAWKNVYCMPVNAAPVASNAQFTGTLDLGESLTASFTYTDAEGDTAGAHIYTWYRADDTSGTNQTQIQTGTGSTYSLTLADVGSYIAVEVIPVAVTGSSPGVASTSSFNGPVFDPAIVPWINEVHYDDVDADEEEGVEIAGPAGLDLSDYTLVFYNGGNNQVYDSLALSGLIDNESNGFGAVWFDRAGIQNGSPDGIALVDNTTNTVLEFISYEGSFTAADGAANGLTSVDIGVTETNSTPNGSTLQLVGGPGNQPGDFSWTGPVAHSRGDLNNGQTIIN